MTASLCRLCGGRIHYLVTRFAWLHDQPGADHAPVPGIPE